MGERDRKPVAEGSDLFLWLKVKAWIWSCNWLPIYASLVIFVTWHFHIRKLFLFWSLSGDFSINMESLSFLPSLYKKVIVFCFFRFICWENGSTITWQQKCYTRFPAFLQCFQRTASSLLHTYRKHIKSKKYCNAWHNDKRCFLPNFRYHISLLSNVEELR